MESVGIELVPSRLVDGNDRCEVGDGEGDLAGGSEDVSVAPILASCSSTVCVT
jgi:hypothetical protein